MSIHNINLGSGQFEPGTAVRVKDDSTVYAGRTGIITKQAFNLEDTHYRIQVKVGKNTRHIDVPLRYVERAAQ